MTANDVLAGAVQRRPGRDGTVDRVSGRRRERLPTNQTSPQSDGSFSFQPAGLSYGSAHGRGHARVVGPLQNAYVSGQAASVTFTYEYEAPAAPIIADLALTGNVGTSATGPESTDGAMQGRIIAQGPLDGATVDLQYLHDGTLVLQAQTTTDSLGNFSYTPAGLPQEALSVQAQASLFEQAGQQTLTSEWTSPYAFTCIADTAPAVAALTLAHNLAASGGAAHGADPTVSGQIAGAAGVSPASLSGVTIQFEQGYVATVDGNSVDEWDGTTQGLIDGTNDKTPVAVIVGTTTTDANGDFSYTPTGLPTGELVVVQARAETIGADETATYGAWVACTFTLNAPAATAVEVTSLALAGAAGCVGQWPHRQPHGQRPDRPLRVGQPGGVPSRSTPRATAVRTPRPSPMRKANSVLRLKTRRRAT